MFKNNFLCFRCGICGGIGCAIVSIIVVIVVAVLITIFYNTVKDTDACVSYKYEDYSLMITMTIPPFMITMAIPPYMITRWHVRIQTVTYIYHCFCSTNGGSDCLSFEPPPTEVLFSDLANSYLMIHINQQCKPFISSPLFVSLSQYYFHVYLALFFVVPLNIFILKV